MYVKVILNLIISFEGCFICPLVCSLADLQVVVVAVGVNLVTGVDMEHRVQTLGGAGILFKLLHLAEIYTEAERRGRKREVKGKQAAERENVDIYCQFISSPMAQYTTVAALNTFKNT